MKTKKREEYQTPFIEVVVLDNEISLVLNSDPFLPPLGPGDEIVSTNNENDFFNGYHEL